jgi:hypothetical protein
MSTTLDQNRVSRGALIQLRRHRHALLGQIQLIPRRGGADPLPLRRDGSALADQLKELGDALRLPDR